MQSRAIQSGADLFQLGWIGELHVDVGSATELHAHGQPVPDQHGKNAGDAEDQGEGEKAPFPAEKVNVRVAKKFHFI